MTKSITPKVATEKARDPKIAPKVSAETASDTHRKIAPKVAAEKARDTHPKIAPNVASEKARDTQGKIAAQSDKFRLAQAPDSKPAFAPQVPDSMRALAERSVAQTRELYERSTSTLHAVLETWERSLDAAGQGVVALNRKIIDIAERNISTGFELATSLAGAKNLVEVMEVQRAYLRKQFGDLKMHAEEVRALSTKVTADIAEPIKEQIARR